MFEHRLQPLVPRRVFVARVSRHALAALALVGGTLAVGMAGYHWLEDLPWIDAYVNAAMILGGMGPVSALHTTGGKVFAGTYALFAGIVFLVGVSVVFAPIVHRAMHRFHIADEEPPRA
jgi:hypothetical protein